VLEPAILHHREQISDLLQEATAAAFDGDKQGVAVALERAGVQGQNIAQGWFTNSANDWSELKKKTIKRKGSEQSLIDTGELRKSIRYKIEKK